MPALYLFRRRTLLAGDDLQLPSLAWGSVSAAQLFVLVPYLLYYAIELALTTSPSSDGGVGGGGVDDGAYDGWGGGNYDDDAVPWSTEAANRRLNEEEAAVDDDDANYDYFASIEKLLPNSMQSSACRAATLNYTDFEFPVLLIIYLAGAALYGAASLYYERRIFRLSSLGTPTMHLESRAPLAECIEFKMTFLAGYNASLLLFGSTATYIFMSGFVRCFATLWWVAWFVLFGTQAVQCLLGFTTLVSILRTTKPVVLVSSSESPAAAMMMESMNNNADDFYRRHVDAATHAHDNAEMAEQMWQSRCEGCCRVLAVSTCFLFGGKGIVTHAAEGGGERFYGDIARVLADYFADFNDGNGGNGGDTGLDVVPSDVGLGFVMLRHTQAQRKMVARRDALRQTRTTTAIIGNGNDNNYGSRSGSNGDLSSAERDGRPSSPLNVDASSARADTPQLSPNKTTLLFRRDSESITRTPTEQIADDGNDDDDDDVHPSTTAQPEEEAYASYSRTVLSPSNPEDYSLLEEGARFARHQLAIYTWILYYYQFPITGTFRLIGRSIKAKMKCSNSTTPEAGGAHASRGRSNTYEPCSDVEAGIARPSSPTAEETMNYETINGDNFLGIHEATMLAHAGLEQSDIAYASFEAGFYETPYCIVIDRKWKTVVLSIRGSLTLEDCVVDVLLDPSPLDALGEKYGFDGRGQYCHGGVVGCTTWLHEDLMRHKILQKLLLGENAEYPDYTLRVVGHSLGAGIGVILSLMLRNTFPDLRCICYSPPGGLLTWELAKQCSEFVNSFVLDSDIVPRLSVNNMERLRDEVLHLIARVRLSKYDIAQRIFWHGVCGEVELGDLDYLIQQNEDMLYPHDDIPDSDFSRQLQRFESMQQERRSSRGLTRSISLYPPGRITHLVKTGQSKNCLHGVAGCITCGASNAGSEYTPIQKENDDFNEIEISPTLWTDHFPNRVCAEIERIAERFGIDTTLGSPS